MNGLGKSFVQIHFGFSSSPMTGLVKGVVINTSDITTSTPDRKKLFFGNAFTSLLVNGFFFSDIFNQSLFG